MNKETHKREYLELSDATKARISASMRNKPKSKKHRDNISKAMKAYWSTIPHAPVEGAKNKKSNPQPNVIM